MIPSEEGIAQRILRDAPGAFDEFFDRYAGPLLAYLEGMLHDRSAAEDLVQETMLRVYQRIDRYKERGAFRAWVFRIATNLALTELRRRRLTAAGAPDPEALERPDRAEADPLERLETERRGHAIQAALERLADDQRAVILLRVRDGMSIREIARILCVPEGTVKSRIHHAVRTLREAACGRECAGGKERRDEGM